MPEAMHAGHDGQARLTADIRNPTSKLMLTILAGVATWEREIMREHQREGIAKAKSEAKYKGRSASIDAVEIKPLTATMGRAAIAKHLGIARSTVDDVATQTAVLEPDCMQSEL